jgi:hypothetical protein
VRLGDGSDHEMTLSQRYQVIEGACAMAAEPACASCAWGDRISFSFMDAAGNLIQARGVLPGTVLRHHALGPGRRRGGRRGSMGLDVPDEAGQH